MSLFLQVGSKGEEIVLSFYVLAHVRTDRPRRRLFVVFSSGKQRGGKGGAGNQQLMN